MPASLGKHNSWVYAVSKSDRIEELRDIPQSDTGAPMPQVYATEEVLYVAYLTAEADERTGKEQYALVKFARSISLLFGAPNDEALGGHPLYSRGLTHYSANEVFNSSWIAALVKMNSMHPRHNPKAYESLRHFLFAFHDSTFECIAEGYEVELHSNLESLASYISKLSEK